MTVKAEGIEEMTTPELVEDRWHHKAMAWETLKIFFDGRLLTPDGISFLHHVLNGVQEWRDDPVFKKGLELIRHPVSVQEEYDFTRLFLGPGRVPAPPFGSAYRSPERLLMQEETAAVRQFYRRWGLASKEKGSQPDDFLPVELEFLSFLLFEASHSPDLESVDGETPLQAYRAFLERHVLPWVGLFAEDVICAARTDLLTGVGTVLATALRLEAETLALT